MRSITTTVGPFDRNWHWRPDSLPLEGKLFIGRAVLLLEKPSVSTKCLPLGLVVERQKPGLTELGGLIRRIKPEELNDLDVEAQSALSGDRHVSYWSEVLNGSITNSYCMGRTHLHSLSVSLATMWKDRDLSSTRPDLPHIVIVDIRETLSPEGEFGEVLNLLRFNQFLLPGVHWYRFE